MKIGFVGLGIMGRPMAKHLQAAGHELLIVGHRSPIAEDLLTGGARTMASLPLLATECDTLILMLPDTPDVETVLFGPEGAAAALRPGTIVIDMSSIDPLSTRDIAARIKALGCDFADAPVSGGEVGAKAATLTIMCGAEEPVFERILPLLEVMGKNITRVGDVGAGQVAKVANQMIVALNIGAVAEALLYASKAGADPARVREALMGGFASSRVLEVHGQRMIERNFAPGFRIGLHQKDLNLALQGARALGLSLPATATAQQLFSACVAQRGSDWDHSAMLRALEVLAQHEIG